MTARPGTARVGPGTEAPTTAAHEPPRAAEKEASGLRHGR